jgi:hypothetical protein
VARAFAEYHAMDLKRADAFLRGQHEITDLEPKVEGDLRILKDRPADDAESETLALAAVLVLTDPIKGSRLKRVDLFFGSATRTGSAVGPALRN